MKGQYGRESSEERLIMPARPSLWERERGVGRCVPHRLKGWEGELASCGKKGDCYLINGRDLKSSGK